MKKRIHIFGASGPGTTTLAKNLCLKYGYHHIDTDDFYWLKSHKPYCDERPVTDRIILMKKEMMLYDAWVNSGSITGWGDELTQYFDLAIFLYLPQKERIARIKQREEKTFGADILPGGIMHEHVIRFIEWASTYDTADMKGKGRNLQKHIQWMASLHCPLGVISGIHSEAECLRQASAFIENERWVTPIITLPAL